MTMHYYIIRDKYLRNSIIGALQEKYDEYSYLIYLEIGEKSF